MTGTVWVHRNGGALPIREGSAVVVDDPEHGVYAGIVQRLNDGLIHLRFLPAGKPPVTLPGRIAAASTARVGADVTLPEFWSADLELAAKWQQGVRRGGRDVSGLR